MRSGPRLDLLTSIRSNFIFEWLWNRCREWTNNTKLREWVKQMYALCNPEHLYLCTGSVGENMTLKNQVRNFCCHEAIRERAPHHAPASQRGKAVHLCVKS